MLEEKMKKLISISIAMLFVLAACIPTQQPTQQPSEPDASQPDTVATLVAQTQAAELKPTEPPVESTEPPEPTEPPTEAPPPTVEFIADANCRSGPGVNYDNLVFIKMGATGIVLGKNQQTKVWYKLELPDGKQCWVTADAISISGDASTLANLDAPPTPTPRPKPTWTGTWYVSQWLSAGGTTKQDWNLVMTQKGSEVTFTFEAFGYTYGASATVSEDGTRLDGFARRSGSIPDPIQFTFVMDANNYNQFRGQWYMTTNTSWNGDWCGARNNASLPVPCRNQ